jgi:hypothetical protein
VELDQISVTQKEPGGFPAFYRLNLAVFYELLPSFEQAYEVDLDQRDKERARKRQRERGGGRNGVLSGLENKLLFILFYFKVYPVQESAGLCFRYRPSRRMDPSLDTHFESGFRLRKSIASPQGSGY